MKSCYDYTENEPLGRFQAPRPTQVTATTVGCRPEANNMISIHTHRWQNHYHCAKPKLPHSGDFLKRHAIAIQILPNCVDMMGKGVTWTCTDQLRIMKNTAKRHNRSFMAFYIKRSANDAACFLVLRKHGGNPLMCHILWKDISWQVITLAPAVCDAHKLVTLGSKIWKPNHVSLMFTWKVFQSDVRVVHKLHSSKCFCI